MFCYNKTKLFYVRYNYLAPVHRFDGVSTQGFRTLERSEISRQVIQEYLVTMTRPQYSLGQFMQTAIYIDYLHVSHLN